MCTYVSKNAIKIIEVNNGSRKSYFPLKSIHMLLRFKKCWFKKCWCISSSPNAVCWVPPQSTHPHLPLLNAPCSSAISNSLLCLLYPCFCMPGVLRFRFLYLIWIPSNILTIFLFFLISSISTPVSQVNVNIVSKVFLKGSICLLWHLTICIVIIDLHVWLFSWGPKQLEIRSFILFIFALPAPGSFPNIQ